MWLPILSLSLILAVASLEDEIKIVPWSQVRQLVSIKDANGHICTGTIRGYQLIVTAASCFFQKSLDLSQLTIDTYLPRYQNRRVKTLLFHKDFNPDVPCLNDIVILVLMKPIGLEELGVRRVRNGVPDNFDRGIVVELNPYLHQVRLTLTDLIKIQDGCDNSDSGKMCVATKIEADNDFGGPVMDPEMKKMLGLLPVDPEGTCVFLGAEIPPRFVTDYRFYYVDMTDVVRNTKNTNVRLLPSYQEVLKNYTRF